MVGARGFEPPASWSRTMNRRRINNLAALSEIATRYDMLRQISRLRTKSPRILAIHHNASMHRVGIVLGIVARAWNAAFPLPTRTRLCSYSVLDSTLR